MITPISLLLSEPVHNFHFQGRIIHYAPVFRSVYSDPSMAYACRTIIQDICFPSIARTCYFYASDMASLLCFWLNEVVNITGAEVNENQVYAIRVLLSPAAAHKLIPFPLPPFNGATMSTRLATLRTDPVGGFNFRGRITQAAAIQSWSTPGSVTVYFVRVMIQDVFQPLVERLGYIYAPEMSSLWRFQVGEVISVLGAQV
ncbi:hypothetical protein EDD21DRAFT_353757 [Dissophora ornata]|nr:hypothetical protein EDD21DRAFT_353757 [Dissophora ornata]